MEKEYKRSKGEVRTDFDNVFRDEIEISSRREESLVEVLRRVPSDDYRTLREENFKKYRMFMEHESNLGKVYPIVSSDGIRIETLIYLSPILESGEIDISSVVAVTAHELAHFIRNHDPWTQSVGKQMDQEVDAWNYACKWGFREEVKNHLEWRKETKSIKVTFNPQWFRFRFVDRQKDPVEIDN